MTVYKPFFFSRFIFSPCTSILTARNLLNEFTQKSHVSNKVLMKLGLPLKPKKPLTPFFKYLSLMRPKVAEKNVFNKTTDMIKFLSDQWKKEDVNLKQRLQEEYNSEIAEYINIMVKYEDTITPEQRQVVSDYKAKMQANLEQRNLKKKMKSLDKPKKPLNSFLYFMHKEKQNMQPDENFIEWKKKTINKWNELSMEEKSKYQDKVKSLQEKYLQDVKDWEIKMIRLGHLDVVSTKNLFHTKTKGANLN